jgi:hypothetical protein
MIHDDINHDVILSIPQLHQATTFTRPALRRVGHRALPYLLPATIPDDADVEIV